MQFLMKKKTWLRTTVKGKVHILHARLHFPSPSTTVTLESCTEDHVFPSVVSTVEGTSQQNRCTLASLPQGRHHTALPGIILPVVAAADQQQSEAVKHLGPSKVTQDRVQSREERSGCISKQKNFSFLVRTTKEQTIHSYIQLPPFILVAVVSKEILLKKV